ncbi:S9 family peptidase [Sphingomonas sp. ID1715]|uniref:S9 family peptidase n=1 Tax=Sphingomonas sp. ID1715 TaxID=1656898 RepID=UPI001489701E|nr:alpha/beta fold hydrolase [Sphingomonas sp. ID1715]NNM75815.1 S9 family peptidase [Sphingomonas sp. ID1715]
MIRILAALAALSLAPSAMAQTQKLTLERIYGNPPLSGPTPRLVKLSPDGRWLTSLRNRPDEKERFDLWAVDTSTGAERMLVDSRKFATGAELSEAERMRRERARIADQTGIVAYDWSADARSLLVPLDGDLYLATLDGQVRRLTATPTSELDGTVSPRGKYVSFVRDQNLVVLDLATGKERALTRDGRDTLSWGVAEFIAQEEMDRRRGHWWSPDDKRIAVARVDESPVAIVTRSAIGADGTRVYAQRYPKAGTPNARVELYVFGVRGGKPVKVDLGPDPDIYLARVNWTADGSALLVQRESRDQKRLDLLSVDPVTGKSSVLFTETAQTWINLHDNLRALADGSILWTSERDGFSHLYRWRDGQWTQLTRGPWQVQQLLGVDGTRNRVWFTANRDTPLEWHVYSTPLDAPGEPQRLTEPGYSYGAKMDEAATRLILSRSSTTQPPQDYLADDGGKRLLWINENKVAGDHPYAPFLKSHVAAEFGTLKAVDGQVLHYKLYRPRGAVRPGPVLQVVYGGPHGGRQVVNQWNDPFYQYLVDKGWTVFSIDNRGTADRGKRFEDAIYHAMGAVEVEDQLAGLAWLKRQPFVDPKRVAVYGWSYGGYMTLKLLEAAPGAFAAGVAGAPVTRWELYDTHYTERFLGNPAIDPKPYESSDALANATAIRDPLLLIHGMSDDNVVFDNSTALMAKLQAAAIPFETMVYPGFGHRVAGPGVSVHVWRTIATFLDRQLGEAK